MSHLKLTGVRHLRLQAHSRPPRHLEVTLRYTYSLYYGYLLTQLTDLLYLPHLLDSKTNKLTIPCYTFLIVSRALTIPYMPNLFYLTPPHHALLYLGHLSGYLTDQLTRQQQERSHWRSLLIGNIARVCRLRGSLADATHLSEFKGLAILQHDWREELTGDCMRCLIACIV